MHCASFIKVTFCLQHISKKLIENENFEKLKKKSIQLHFQDESWDKRWLRNSKVSKVLATAKLANKVRSKIKERKSKPMPVAPPPPEETEPPKKDIPETPADVEVGSVEHYKELTKQK